MNCGTPPSYIGEELFCAFSSGTETRPASTKSILYLDNQFPLPETQSFPAIIFSCRSFLCAAQFCSYS